ncbi:MAG: lipopolysaccharide kinase InaA family protein [Halieaceae bacterium]
MTTQSGVTKAGIVRGEGSLVPVLQEALQKLDSPTSWLEQHGRALKSEQAGTVGLLELAGQDCYIKFFCARSRVQRLGFALGLSRAARAFDAGLSLAKTGLPVAQPLACLRLPDAMVLLTTAIHGTDLKALWLSQREEDDWTLIMSRAAATLARLHGEGFVHGDCKWGNLLWDGSEVVMVDLDGVQRSTSTRRQGRDLARFVLNAEELSVDKEIFETFVSVYAKSTGSAKTAVIELLAPVLVQLRRRHKDKYGQRGVRLVGE